MFLVFIMIWIGLIAWITILQSLGFVSKEWKKLSIVENLISIYLKTENSDKNKKNEEVDHLFTSSSSFIQFISIIVHYAFEFFNEKDLPSIWPMSGLAIDQIVYLIYTINKISLFYAFFINGVTAFKWLFRIQSWKSNFNWRIYARFYLRNLREIAPFYYFLIVFNNFYLKYLISDSMKDPLIERVCRESVVSNMLFISNFSRPDRMVRINMLIIYNLC